VLLLAAAPSAVLADDQCTVASILGCYEDSMKHRLLNISAAFCSNPTDGDMTQQKCAELCCAKSLTPSAIFGVEYGCQCWCGAAFAPGVEPNKVDASQCNLACSGDSTQKCGGSNHITLFKATKCPCIAPTPPPTPSPPLAETPLFHGCLSDVARSHKYCDTSLSHEERADDVVSQLSTDEQISLLSPTMKPFCAVHTPAIDRIGMTKYKWLTETNSAVSNTGCFVHNGVSKCATQFIGPLGQAASFNRSSWWMKGDVVSTDLRAYNNLNQGETGLMGFGPNINMLKDPRYGRNSELAGEDPYLSGEYGAAYTKGMQQIDSNGTYKMLSYLKHYTAYSVESSRFTFVANVSMFDFWDSYLPQYEIAFTKGQSSGAMCSYFAPNGESCCGNDYLLNQVIRGKWNRPDAVVMSDCSAVANMQKNGYAHSPEDASAKAMNAGMDIYGGWDDDLWTQGFLAKAITEGLTTNATVAKSFKRTMMQKLKVGLFDGLEGQKWTDLEHFGLDALNSSYAQQVSFEAALQGLILLKNDDGALPLKMGMKVAVVGPMSVETKGLLSDYANDLLMPSTQASIADAIHTANTGGTTTVDIGVDISSSDTSKIGTAIAAVKMADAIVMVLGQTKALEHEGIDRKDTKLPGQQENFALQVLAAALKKPVVLVLCNGGILSIDNLLSAANPPGAVIEAFNPAVMGPRALAETAFGQHNRWGKLPVTIYPANYTDLVAIQEMSFTNTSTIGNKSLPGRGYRYYQGTPLYSFGEGLSYTSFTHTCKAATSTASAGFYNFVCDVSNTGSREGDEVLMVYHKVGDSIKRAIGSKHPIPSRKLVAFDRVSLAKGATHALAFTIQSTSLSLTTNTGERVVYPGEHELVFSRGTKGTESTIKVTVSPAEATTF